MGGSRHLGFRASLTAERVSATGLVGKGRFLNVIFESSNFANLIPSEDTATKRPRWVYYTRMSLVYPFVRVLHLAYIIYNTRWRGLAELLILVT